MIMNRKPKMQKAVLTLTGVGGSVRVNVAGLKPENAVRLRTAVRPKQGPALATVVGVESGEGYVNVSWVATSALKAYRLPVEVVVQA